MCSFSNNALSRLNWQFCDTTRSTKVIIAKLNTEKGLVILRVYRKIDNSCWWPSVCLRRNNRLVCHKQSKNMLFFFPFIIGWYGSRSGIEIQAILCWCCFEGWYFWHSIQLEIRMSKVSVLVDSLITWTSLVLLRPNWNRHNITRILILEYKSLYCMHVHLLLTK